MIRGNLIMGKLYIAFENETIDDIELVDDEREEVIEQLDRRRIAMSQINDIAQSSDDNIDANTLVKDSLTDGLESHTALHVLTKSVIQGIKTCGLANENIAELAIANKNACLLMHGYYNLFTSNEFNEFISAISQIGTTLFPESAVDEITIGIDVNNDDVATTTVTVHDYCQTLGETKSKLEATVKSVIDEFDDKDGEAYTSWKTETVDTLENSEVRAKVVVARDQCNAYLESINSIFELISDTISRLSDDSADGIVEADLEANLEDLKSAYELVCKKAEIDYFADKITALEAIAEQCYAFEGFRDTAGGRLLSRIFAIVKDVFKTITTAIAVNIVYISDAIQNLILKIAELVAKTGIEKKSQAVVKAGITMVNISYRTEPPMIGFTSTDGVIYNYELGSGILSASIKPLDSDVKMIGGSAVRFKDYKSLSRSLRDRHKADFQYGGVYVSASTVYNLLFNALTIVDRYRDTIVDYVKTGDSLKLTEFMGSLANLIARGGFLIAANTNLSNYDTKDILSINNNSGATPSNSLVKISRQYIAWCKLFEQKAANGDFLGGILPEFDNFDTKLFKAISNNLPSLSKRVGSSFDNIDRVISTLGSDESTEQRAVVAKECTLATCTMFKFIVNSAYNTLRAIKRQSSLEATSDVIAIKLIDRMYKTIDK